MIRPDSVSPTSRPRVVVAMSGGVDSSVAAVLLRDRGHDVIGVTLRLQPCSESQASRSCCGSDGIARAREVAAMIDVPHYVLDCVDQFSRNVLEPSWGAYQHGQTPSPCFWCNQRIKFGFLLDWANGIGAASIASGHYAQTGLDDHGQPGLWRGSDLRKDQSYFLAGLSPTQMGRLLLPLGDRCKDDVRLLARSMGLPAADARDSQDACLVGNESSFAEMLRKRMGADKRTGPILAVDGQALGRHNGIHNFTVGQRKGLNVVSSRRMWVRTVRASDAAVIVSADPQDLFRDRFSVGQVNWLVGVRPEMHVRCAVQVRSQQLPVPGLVIRTGFHSADVILDEAVRAIAPGQVAVFRGGPRVLGCGWIDSEP